MLHVGFGLDCCDLVEQRLHRLHAQLVGLLLITAGGVEIAGQLLGRLPAGQSRARRHLRKDVADVFLVHFHPIPSAGSSDPHGSRGIGCALGARRRWRSRRSRCRRSHRDSCRPDRCHARRPWRWWSARTAPKYEAISFSRGNLPVLGDAANIAADDHGEHMGAEVIARSGATPGVADASRKPGYPAGWALQSSLCWRPPFSGPPGWHS